MTNSWNPKSKWWYIGGTNGVGLYDLLVTYDFQFWTTDIFN